MKTPSFLDTKKIHFENYMKINDNNKKLSNYCFKDEYFIINYHFYFV